MPMTRLAQILHMKNDILMNHEFRKDFRLRIRENLKKHDEVELPSMSKIQYGPAIDEDTILKLNELMSNSEKRRFLISIIRFKNTDLNIYHLILNSSDEVRQHITKLLQYSVYDMNILNHYYYPIGNIFLYILANNKDKVNVGNQIFIHLKNAMLMYNPEILEPFKIIKENYDNFLKIEDLEIKENQLIKKDTPLTLNDCLIKLIKEEQLEKKKKSEDILEVLELKTDDQLEEHKNKFFSQVDEQEEKEKFQKRTLKILGVSLFIQIVLVAALGLPPLSRLVTATVTNIFDSDQK